MHHALPHVCMATHDPHPSHGSSSGGAPHLAQQMNLCTSSVTTLLEVDTRGLASLGSRLAVVQLDPQVALALDLADALQVACCLSLLHGC